MGSSSMKALVKAFDRLDDVLGANSSTCGLGVARVRFWDDDSQERSILLHSSPAIVCKILDSKNFSDA
jgi:hypothetical protein